MDKVLVERPRWTHVRAGRGSHYPRGKLAGIFDRDFENAPSRLGMSARHADKWLNENLAPLRRYLQRQVGRPWDKVRAEIALHVRRDNAVQAHIYQHLQDFVETRVFIVDGVPHGAGRWGSPRPLYERHRGTPLWVCPKSGILRRPLPNPRPPERFGKTLRLDRSRELRQVDGQWLHVTLAPFNKEQLGPGLFDILIAEELSADWFGYRGRYGKLFDREDAFAIALREPASANSSWRHV